MKNLEACPRFYVGLTADVNARLEDHNAGRCPHTAAHRPWRLCAMPCARPLHIKCLDEDREKAGTSPGEETRVAGSANDPGGRVGSFCTIGKTSETGPLSRFRPSGSVRVRWARWLAEPKLSERLKQLEVRLGPCGGYGATAFALDHERRLVDQNSASWNRVHEWLTQVSNLFSPA